MRGRLARLGYAESIVERVRNLLICGEGGYPSVDDVARELHVSARTLKRKLAEYGATYSTLLDEIRLRDALRLLEARGCRSTRLPRASAIRIAPISRARSSAGRASRRARR